eukprot:scaffold43229_cov55-Phaeocystis_antarctica.AAC.1
MSGRGSGACDARTARSEPDRLFGGRDRQTDRQFGTLERHTAAARLLRDSSTATQQCALAAPHGPPNEAPQAPTTSPTIFSTP